MQKSIIDPVINQLKDKIMDAKNNLNGAEKLQNAKIMLNTYLKA